MTTNRSLFLRLFQGLPLLSLSALTLGTGCQSSGMTSKHFVSNDGDCRTPAACMQGARQHGSRADIQCRDQRRVRQRDSAECERPFDFSKCAVPAPPGTYVQGWNAAMIGAARIDRYVINRHEWFAGGHQLGPRGRMHVLDLAQDLSVGGGSVIIESEPVQLAPQEALDDAIARTEDLNELRRMTVIDMLVTNGVPDAEGRVIVSGIDRVGPRGIESPRIYNQLLRGGQQGGGGGMGGGGMGGGMGGGGMGGGMGGGGFF